MTHAFFKALLFLGAGSVIHAMSGEQDLLRMGGPAAAYSDDLLDHGGRRSGDQRNLSFRGILQQGRDSLVRLG